MSVLLAVRVFGDLCLYFALSGAIGGVCGQTMTLWWPAAICAGTMGVVCLLKDKPGRVLALLLLLPCLLLPKTAADWVILTPALLYAAALAVSGRFNLDQGDYLDFFPRGLIALGIMLLVSLLGLDMGQLLRYGAAFVICGVYLMRQLRLQTGSDWKDKLLNLAVLAAVICAGALSSYFVRGLGWLVTWLWGRMKWLFALLERLLSGIAIPDAAQPPVEESPDVPLASPDAPEVWMDFVPANRDAREVVKTVVIVLVITSAVVGAILLIRRMLGSFNREKTGEKQPVWTERAEGERRTQRRTGLSNRDRIRRAYQKFLRLLQGKGAVLLRNHTTADVHMQAVGYTEQEPAEELRDLYRLARYDDGADITSEQVRKAKELLRKLD